MLSPPIVGGIAKGGKPCSAICSLQGARGLQSKGPLLEASCRGKNQLFNGRARILGQGALLLEFTLQVPLERLLGLSDAVVGLQPGLVQQLLKVTGSRPC